MGARSVRSVFAIAATIAGCAPLVDPTSPGQSALRPPSGSTPSGFVEPSSAAAPPGSATAGAVPPRAAPLTLDGARRYMVQLINRDRASIGLGPVELDEGPPTRAGQGHAEDMARNAYLGHWGSDGSVPEQRYTEAGGTDMVLENASCFTDEHPRQLDPHAGIDPRNVEQAEDMFFHEQPPNDGHRKNILKPWHKRVRVRVAQPVATPTEIPVPCFAQEFVDAFGTYAPAPAQMRVGDALHVSGQITRPATFAGVGLARVGLPGPISVAELNRRRSYPVPAPYQMYWPPGFQTPIPVQVTGDRFSVTLPVSDGGQPGLYELSVWAQVPGTKDLTMVSLRTIRVH